MRKFLGGLPFMHIGLCLAMGQFYYISIQGDAPAPDKSIIPTYRVIGIAMALVLSFAALMLPRFLLAKFQLEDSSIGPITSEQFMKLFPGYQRAKIVQWTLLVGAGMLNAAFFFLTAHMPFLFIAGTMLVLLAFLRPSIGDFARRLEIPEAQRASLKELS